jgi:hypothetical protein
MAKPSNLKTAYGILRENRYSAALDPASAPVDERSCAELMAFALDFSRLLSFYGSNNRPISDWYDFFVRDISFLPARIVTTDFQRDYFHGWALQHAVREGQEKTKEILKAIYQMAKRMDDWYLWAAEVAKKNREDNALRMTLESIIKTDLRHYLSKHIDGILRQLPSRPGRETWSEYWARRESRLHPYVWSVSESEEHLTAIPRYDSPVDGLLAILRALHQSNHKLHDVAGQYLDELLETRSDHPPHTALYISFCKLLLPLRDKINHIPDRHLDFYYREVLRLSERGSAPDVAHVCFEVSPEIKSYTLPAGTRLTAGKDPNGKLIEYETDQELFINHARVASLKAVYLVQDNLGLASETPQRVTGILALPKADSEDGQGAPFQAPELGWPTFGVDEVVKDGPDLSSLNAELGFMVSSPTLMLQEGERNIVVTLAFAGDTSLRDAWQGYLQAAREVLDEMPGGKVLPLDAFLAYASGEKGWIPLPNATFRRHAIAENILEIEFSFKSIDPAIVPNPLAASVVEGGGEWPLFKLILNPYARVYAYPFFRELRIESVKIRATVRGVRKLQLRNELGPLDPAQPFPIFGSIAGQGSYLLVNHRELNVKKIEDVTLSVTWFNLPKPPDSLETYYAGYGLGIRDDSFKLRVSVFGEERWESTGHGNVLFPMFAQDYDRSRGLLQVTVIAAEMPEIPMPSVERPAPSVLSETEAPRGTLRVELAEPGFGFGHHAFPSIMADAAIKNAKAGKNGTHQPMPHPPFVPIAKAVALDYDAAETLVLTRPLPENQKAKFYSIHPFGHLSHPGGAARVFPDFQEQGHLYVGVGGAGPRQAVTLLFQICDTAFSPVPKLHHRTEAAASSIRWRYLSGHEWKDLPSWLLLSDSTMGLTRSGIVKLSLPADIVSESTLMPAGLCWMEVAAPQVAGVYWSRVVSIATQAVTATRICDPQSELLPVAAPAYSIAQLKHKLPQIKSVRQPFPSNNGRSRETPAQFRTRVSERLRHKDRAIQGSDFERMILERFPEVGQVKCIGHNNSRDFPGTEPVPSGTIYLAVTPRLEDIAEREPRLPQHVLRKIEAYVRSHTSVFVKDIHVMNPVYETLKIFANVEFSLDGDAAGYIEALKGALSQHLQRWRGKPANAMPIGSGQIQSYEIALFIQQQPYVNRLHSLRLLHTYRTEEGYVSRWISKEDRAYASAPWAVLISAEQHSIVPVDPGKKDFIDEGIRNLTVGSDFVMGGTAEEEKSLEEKKEDARELRYFLVVPAHREHWNQQK